jgi:hypothetical protein
VTRLDKLHARRVDPAVVTATLAKEAYRRINDTDAVRYAIGAMQPIDPEYTKNTYRQGDRVKDQLKARLTESCDYEYQGSTTNDTHIKAKSDIDLLVLITRWIWLEDGLPNHDPYHGDSKSDLRDLRSESEESIDVAFPAATVDTSGSTAISVEGGSLTRRVEVVPATWFDTMDYRRTGDKIHRGVKVFDRTAGLFSLNRPFLFNHRVAEKDAATFGGMRKAARLMKSLKYDSEYLDISSYNITSIAWNIPNHMLVHIYPQELRILEACREYCGLLRVDSRERNSIRVPDDSRFVFDGKGAATLKQLDDLIAELDQLIRDIFKESARSYAKLADARIEYGLR